MGKFIDKNALIGDDYRAVILCEYTHDLSLIKQLIEIAEKAVSLKKPSDTWTSDGMCYLFAKSIVSYAKMAYDNMILGHFDATNMIDKSLVSAIMSIGMDHMQYLGNTKAEIAAESHMPAAFDTDIQTPDTFRNTMSFAATDGALSPDFGEQGE